MYIDRLGNMGGEFPMEFAIGLILISFPNSYKQFVKNVHMKKVKVTVIELSNMLMAEEAVISKKENSI